MARTLSLLLGADEPVFSTTITGFEDASGRPSTDVRLVAELIRKVHHVISELGLDPQDTTDGELYAALMQQVKHHDEQLVEALGCTRASTPNELLACIVDRLNSLKIPKSCWAIRSSAFKKLLRQKPPRALMKYMGYKSIDSLLKRQPVEVLAAALPFVESRDWLKSFIDSYKKLGPSDFESRSIKIVLLDNKRWGKAVERYLKVHRQNIIPVKEMGLVAVGPLPVESLPGVATVMLSLMLHYINAIRAYTTFVKLQQMAPNVGEIVAQNVLDESPRAPNMAEHSLPWRVVHRYFASVDPAEHPEIFEPHVQADDFGWINTEAVLSQIVPDMAFWRDLNYVGSVQQGRPLSLNVCDVAVNYCNRLPFDRQSTYFLRLSLGDELLRRYLEQPVLNAQVFSQLATDDLFDDVVEEPDLLTPATIMQISNEFS